MTNQVETKESTAVTTQHATQEDTQIAQTLTKQLTNQEKDAALDYAKYLTKTINKDAALEIIGRTFNNQEETYRQIKQYVNQITEDQMKRESNLSMMNGLQQQMNAAQFSINTKGSNKDIEAIYLNNKNQLDKFKIQFDKNFGDNGICESVKNKLAEIVNCVANEFQPKVPEGKDDKDNVLFKGLNCFSASEKYDGPEIREFDFKPLSHDEIGVRLGMMNFEAAAEICGSRFTILLDDLCKLERALAAYMLDVANNAGFMEVTCPSLVKPSALFGTGQLPKFGDDIFRIADDDNCKALVPTSEVTLTNLFANKHWQEAELPVKMVSYSQCFRKEAGSAGRDTKGMFRQHQFGKVELVVGTVPTLESSENAHMMMLKTVETVLKGLELPYRITTLCKGDTGFGSSLTYDFEVWVPSRGEYKEISSVSNCLNFQARRMKARFKAKDKASPIRKEKYIHTLNGSCVAIGRAIVAVLENHQNEDGSVTVPAVLRGYMGGLEVIKPNGKEKMFKR